MRNILILLLTLFTVQSLDAEEPAIQYQVVLEGIHREETEQLLRSASQLIKLKKHPPKSLASLKRRAELDIPYLVKALHSLAYYNAKISFNLQETDSGVTVVYQIEPGPIYPLANLEIFPETLNIKPYDLGITLNRPAYPSDILAAEETLIFVLNQTGYPLARLIDREVIADQKTKSLHVKLHVDPGMLAYFGQTKILGLETVKNKLVERKIRWRVGEVYDPSKIECTIGALESLGVFSSISITNEDELDDQGNLPMTIQVTEGKHRSIGLGVGYSTQRGPGITAEWEHRNFRGMGEKLRANINALMETQEGSISYLVPDFYREGQDLIYAAEVEHDDTKGYEKTSLSFSAALERQLTPCLRISYGGMYEYLKSTKENKDGSKDTDTYNLTRIPLKLRWSTVNDPLDPCSGATVFLKGVPTFQLIDEHLIYTITTLTGSVYKPFSRERRFIAAAKINIGSIWGSSRSVIPGSDRFHAGSDNTLRGYNYETVSPLSDDADPIGGRSLLVYSLEGRWRITDNWGTVLFYDIGNVFSDTFPKFNGKMLQSIGLGLRYYTPVGPLRLDIAYPLNRRKAFDKDKGKKTYIDDPYQIYFSVGQSF